MADIALTGLRKTFGRVVAIRDLSLHVGDGEFLVLLGPSGCGKTTTLRAIAGLETLDRGRVVIGGRDVTRLPPGRRGIAMVFQSYAVFPHMTVYDNIVFGLRMHRLPVAEQRRRAREAAELLEIADLLDRFPAQLSGGQRQRVAVARAIVMRPDVLLMDEPLSNLDALLRLHMRAELKRLHRELGSTTVYVTHDQVEALSLGDRIAVMRDGQIVQCDTPARIYDTPATRFVGEFIGTPPMNFLPGELTVDGDGPAVAVAGVRIPLPSGAARLAARGGPVDVGIRPEHLEVLTSPAAGALPAEVVVVEPVGPTQLVTARVARHTVKVTVPADAAVASGQRVWLRAAPSRIRLMDAVTGEALSTP
ncbi:MAG: ABC transporter ATP-binding protein [Armatimonadota bacterium]|nr:ABC transporter ATP-binding protein [Armatimonadota bacterium]MDR7402080.1 ABC transporter ATP-binding protein [Armatimonadota bacterium]MDR7437094.1 ABC transporter ATP-binding protein [Armatimonadota bacterium]MDR7506656.1 ABC transporter ATP-binding protein [Armatimonadota bacterium]MDR7509214.1 ABC transporter ATP-binding protein [Armatimonadota bacterium]